MKALSLLESNKTTKEKASSYVVSIARSLKRNVLETLQDKIDKLKDENFDLENFALDTDLNKNLRQMTKEDCELRFKKLIDNQFEIEMLELELASKTKVFNTYFNEEQQAV